MKQVAIAAAIVTAALAVTTSGQGVQRAGLNPALERNKDVLERYFTLADKGDVAGLAGVVGAGYIEHASYAADGRDALLKRVTENLQVDDAGARRERSELIRMIAEHDQVWTYSRVNAAGTAIARIEMFRLEDGKIAEHWTVQEKVNRERTNANDQWAVGKGPRSVEGQPKRVSKAVSPAELERNKLVGRLLFQYAEATDTVERKKLLDIATPEYIQHNARGSDGIQAFTTRPNPLPHDMNVRMLAEGDFVWSLNVPDFAQGAREGIERVNFNQWRIENGRLAEHWGTYESVPAQRLNTNDFLGYGRTHTRDFTR